MRLMLVAALGAAVLAGATGAVEGWRHSPDYPNGQTGYWGMVATHMPDRAPVYVQPECTLTMGNTFKAATGSAHVLLGQSGKIPPGFVPVRAVRCSAYGDSSTLTETQSELRDPTALNSLVSAYRTASVREYVAETQVCPAMAEFDPAIALVDAEGIAIIPGAPRGTCDLIVPAVITAAEKGPWTVTASATVHY